VADPAFGLPSSRVKVTLSKPVAHKVRSDRNNIIIDFVPGTTVSAPVGSPSASRAPDAMLALATQAAPGAESVQASTPVAPIQVVRTSTTVPQFSPGPQAGSFAAQAGQTKYTGTPVSFDFEDADLRYVLRVFQEISGLNIVIDPEVKGIVNLVLREVPWDQALDVILRTHKLGYNVEGTIVRIAPLGVLAAEEDERRKLAEAQADAGDLHVVTKRLSYAKVDDLQNLLKQSVLSKRGNVQIDPRTNTLIITDLESRLKSVDDLIFALDRPQPQVEIEARIVQTNKNFSRALGIQWGFNGRVDPALGNTTNLAFPNSGSLSGRAGGAQGPNGVPTAVSMAAQGATSAVGLALGSVNGALNLDVALSALEQSGNGRLLSTPRVSTLNNVEAEIAQGVQVPYQTTSNNTITTEFKDAALILKVLPQITAANTVIMRISVDKGSVGPIFNGVPSVNTQRANTTVLVNDGETTVIGGIFEGDQRTSADRTPGLSQVPLLGWLFKRDTLSQQDTELLIFITPRIIR
jgi:type IV pilus assembly protein PilQ